jgi:hypothetical protein
VHRERSSHVGFHSSGGLYQAVASTPPRRFTTAARWPRTLDSRFHASRAHARASTHTCSGTARRPW